MKQPRATSFFKSVVSTAVGFGVAMIANALVLPLFGYTPTLKENVLITCIYTVISIARGYALERVFEALGWRTRMSAFAMAVLAERQRQITHEGWSPEHDDAHPTGELARAGACYALAGYHHPVSGARDDGLYEPTKHLWPWDREWLKPQDRRRNLVKAGALILAEGDRFDRQRRRRPEGSQVQSGLPSPDSNRKAAASA